MPEIHKYGIRAHIAGVSEELGWNFSTPEAAQDFLDDLMSDDPQNNWEYLGYIEKPKWAYIVDENGLALD